MKSFKPIFVLTILILFSCKNGSKGKDFRDQKKESRSLTEITICEEIINNYKEIVNSYLEQNDEKTLNVIFEFSTDEEFNKCRNIQEFKLKIDSIDNLLK